MKKAVFASASLALILTACGHFSVTPSSDVFEEKVASKGKVELKGDLAFVSVEGTPEDMGNALGEVLEGPTKDLLSSWAFLDRIRALIERPVPAAKELGDAIPERYHREIEALAKKTGIDLDELLRANAVVDACSCTAFAASASATSGAPLVVGRNMDFAPAKTLGRTTIIQIVRPEGAKAFAAVGWPGFSSVASGINEDGVVVAVLVNSAAKAPGEGVSVGFLTRMILERCATVEDAVKLFHEAGPRSGQFIFIADARTACVVSRDTPDRWLEDDGLLTSTNSKVDDKALVQKDARSRCVNDLLLRTHGMIDRDQARKILGATYMRMENTQSMVFEPAARVLSVARGTTFEPAALDHWTKIELADVLKGTGPLVVSPLDDVGSPFVHYRHFDYPGLRVERALERAARSERRDQPAGNSCRPDR